MAPWAPDTPFRELARLPPGQFFGGHPVAHLVPTGKGFVRSLAARLRSESS
jgi:hypothetical protein